MKVSAQYAEDHFKELLATAEAGEEIEISSEGESSFKLFLVPKEKQRPRGKRILGAGVGELILPTDEEWKAMDKELEDIMVNGPLFPVEKH
jgi:antitoxin (DNA-binding transcriptional repressor) of toxin-antitoxin stability system